MSSCYSIKSDYDSLSRNMFLTLRYGQINSLLLKNKNVLLIALVINTKIKVLTKITNEQRCTSSVDSRYSLTL